MKVLVLSHDPYLPADSGQRQRTARLIAALRGEAETSVLVPGMTGPEHRPCPPRRGERARMAVALLRGESLWKARFDDPAIRVEIDRALGGRPDLIVCAGLPSAFLVPRDCGIPLWIDEQNVEWRILERALPHLGRMRRWVVEREVPRLRREEEGSVAVADVVTACSEEDAFLLGGARILRNACGDPEDGYRRDPAQGVLLFTGTMEWEPNVDAACWMAREILPLVRERLPSATLRIVGRKPTPRVRELAALPGVEVVGAVPSVWPELARAAVAVAPVRMGSGTRIKILEAASASVPVVSTTIGAEGLGMRDGREVLLADAASAFAEACASLLTDPVKSAGIGRAAREWRDRTHGTAAFRLEVSTILRDLAGLR
jgi:glycosyltransferase involved in cell wall biosynthesis